MAENKFGGGHTQKKLETVSDYLDFYTTALKNKNFRLKYFDAFAGTGHMKNIADLPLLMDGKDVEVMEGSTKRSLEIENPFAEYHFIEKSAGKVEKLKRMVAKTPSLSSRVYITKGEAIPELEKFCSNLKANERAVVFLDPCGGQVTFELLETVAKTNKIDLWYLFPSGLNVVRQMRKDNTVNPDARVNIDALFGTKDWIDEFVKYREVPDLFGIRTVTHREITSDAVTRYMISRMKTIFKGGVLESWLPLGKGKGQWYSLLFACANPNHRANALAKRVANEIMRKK